MVKRAFRPSPLVLAFADSSAPAAASSAAESGHSAGLSGRFKGVRKRSLGRWVSEIRVPHSRHKIWLGSYSSPEQAARAYDVAAVLLRGAAAAASFLNFSDSTRLVVVPATPGGLFSPRTVQATAAAIANSAAAIAASPSPPPPPPPPPPTQSPQSPPPSFFPPLDHHLPLRSRQVKSSGLKKPASLSLSSSSSAAAAASAAPPEIMHPGSTPTSPGSYAWIQKVLRLLHKNHHHSHSHSHGTAAPFMDQSTLLSPYSQVASSGASYLTAGPGFDDDPFQAFGSLARHGFTAVSAGVTTSKRIATDIDIDIDIDIGEDLSCALWCGDSWSN